MRKWDPLNEGQLRLLRRIAGGDDLSKPDGVSARTSARALQSRGLVKVTRRGGVWRAQVTGAGSFYLEHGHHPDRPDAAEITRGGRGTGARAAGGGGDRGGRAGSAGASSGRVVERARELIERLELEGGTVRLESLGDADRALYRRLVHVCRQRGLVPAGSELYTGRDKGDLVIRLSQGDETGKTEWDRIRLDARRVTTDPQLVAAALEDHPACLRVSESVLPRAVRVARALAEEARRGGYRIGMNTKLKTPKLFLQAGQVRREVTIEEECDQVRHVITDEDRRALRRRSWTPPPEFDSVPSSRLRLQIARDGWDNHDSWSDEKGARLEKRLGQIIADVKAGLAADEQARLEAKRHADEQAAQWKREKEEKSTRWRAAMTEARTQAVETLRQNIFRGAYDAWVGAQEVRRFCAALEAASLQATGVEEQINLSRWISWARAAADRMDPTLEPSVLAGVDFDIEPGPDDLRPFLGEWSPHRPERDYSRTTSAPALPAGGQPDPTPWHPGMRGRPTWWRR